MASPDSINYAIRPNKAVERKLVFEVLSVLSPVFNLAGYRYIGLGAPWFVDVVMAHKVLSISDMISIEKNEILASRARFNKPYACVNVIHGDSESVLRTLDLEDRPSLVWLDYDTGLDGPVLGDLSTLCRRAATGSIIVVSLNAHREQLPTCDENEKEYATLADRMRAVAGDLIPPDVPQAATQMSGYPPYLASILFDQMHRQLRRAGRTGDILLPLFNIGYRDNAPMITVGGVIADTGHVHRIETVLNENDMGGFLDEKRHLKIGVPPLTFKEKAALDQLMPREHAPTDQEVINIGFRLKTTQIEAYHRFYRYYPMFVEVSF